MNKQKKEIKDWSVTQKEDLELVKDFKSGDLTAGDKLVVKYTPFIKSLAKNFSYRNFSSQVYDLGDIEEVFAVCLSFIPKILKNASVSELEAGLSLMPFLKVSITRGLINFARDKQRPKQKVLSCASTDEDLLNSLSVESCEKNIEAKLKLEHVLGCLNQNEKELLYTFEAYNFSPKEVSEYYKKKGIKKPVRTLSLEYNRTIQKVRKMHFNKNEIAC